VIEWHSPDCSNDIDHPGIFVEYSVEVVISHLFLCGIFIFLSMIHPRKMIDHNILHPLFIMNFNIELLEKKDLSVF
jgi:hypothetical protein